MIIHRPIMRSCIKEHETAVTKQLCLLTVMVWGKCAKSVCGAGKAAALPNTSRAVPQQLIPSLCTFRAPQRAWNIAKLIWSETVEGPNEKRFQEFEKGSSWNIFLLKSEEKSKGALRFELLWNLTSYVSLSSLDDNTSVMQAPRISLQLWRRMGR